MRKKISLCAFFQNLCDDKSFLSSFSQILRKKSSRHSLFNDHNVRSFFKNWGKSSLKNCTVAQLHCIVGLQSPNRGAQLKVLELRPSPDTNQEGSNLTLCTAASASCGSCCGLDNISVLEKSSWGYQKPKLTLLRLYGRGGSSSGSTSDYGSGSGFDSRWELGFFRFSIL